MISNTFSVFLDNEPAATTDKSSEIQEEADQLILERSNISVDFIVLIEPGWMEKESWSSVDFIVEKIRPQGNEHTILIGDCNLQA